MILAQVRVLLWSLSNTTLIPYSYLSSYLTILSFPFILPFQVDNYLGFLAWGDPGTDDLMLNTRCDTPVYIYGVEMLHYDSSTRRDKVQSAAYLFFLCLMGYLSFFNDLCSPLSSLHPRLLADQQT